MTTLKQIFLDNQDKFTSEFDEEDVPYWVIENSVKEWLKQKQQELEENTFEWKGKTRYVNVIKISELLEELRE